MTCIDCGIEIAGTAYVKRGCPRCMQCWLSNLRNWQNRKRRKRTRRRKIRRHRTISRGKLK